MAFERVGIAGKAQAEAALDILEGNKDLKTPATSKIQSHHKAKRS